MVVRRATILFSLPGLLLSGCGNSGGPPVVLRPNEAPQFTSAASVSSIENAALAYQVAATDADGDALTFSIEGGADAARFSINASGLLNFLAAPDFDNPADADGNNIYHLTLLATDGRATTSWPLTVTVTNSREGIAVRRIFTGFSLSVAMTVIPGDTRLFVAEIDGDIYYFDPATNMRTFYTRIPKPNTTYMTLFGLALSPDYANDGLLYASYRIDDDFFVTAIDRNKVTAGLPNHFIEVAKLDRFPVQVMMGGWLGVGPDGNIYVATGTPVEDRDASVQDDDNYRGKLLRIRRNPTPGASPQSSFEIVAKGLNQPRTATFSGNILLIGDQPPATRVPGEINRFDIGGPTVNFGWPYRAGNIPNDFFSGREPAGLTAPILEIPAGNGPKQSGGITLGPIYNGPIASLGGLLIFGDTGLGKIWTTDARRLLGATTTLPATAYHQRNEDFAPDVGRINSISSFAMTPDGKLYILDGDGELFEVFAAT